jgi:hypothetical protein
MLDGYDIVFKNKMERELLVLLHGNADEVKGLYEQILASQDWDTFNRSKGAIQAYEDVRARMRAIAKSMHQGDDDEPVRFGGMSR